MKIDVHGSPFERQLGEHPDVQGLLTRIATEGLASRNAPQDTSDGPSIARSTFMTGDAQQPGDSFTLYGTHYASGEEGSPPIGATAHGVSYIAAIDGGRDGMFVARDLDMPDAPNIIVDDRQGVEATRAFVIGRLLVMADAAGVPPTAPHRDGEIT